MQLILASDVLILQVAMYFYIAPKSNRFLLRRVVDEYGLRVEKGTILIQEAGQLSGLIGRSVLVRVGLAGKCRIKQYGPCCREAMR